MEKKNKKKIIKLAIGLIIIFFIIIGIITSLINKKEEENYNKNTNSNEIIENPGNDNQNNEIEKLDDLAENDYFVLYKGVEIPKKVGRVSLTDIKENLKSSSKTRYDGRKYYNYKKDEYVGETIGNFNYEVDSEYKYLNFVSNIEKIAITKEYNAIPRKSTRLDIIPDELKELEKYTIHEIESIDLDGDEKLEYMVLWGEFYERNQIGNAEPISNSHIMLLDSNFKQIANLIGLEDGFVDMDKDTDAMQILTLDDNIMYVDIDEDGVMEIIINIPTIEGEEINIVKYSNGKIDGEVDIKANIYPGNDIKYIAKNIIERYFTIYSLLDNGAEILCSYNTSGIYGINLYNSFEDMKNHLEKSEETITIEGENFSLYNTNVNFDNYKNVILSYVSENLFEKQFMPYCKNVNGFLYMIYNTGKEDYYELTDIEKTNDRNVFKVEYNYVDGRRVINGEVLVRIGQNSSGNYIVTDCNFE